MIYARSALTVRGRARPWTMRWYQILGFLGVVFGSTASAPCEGNPTVPMPGVGRYMCSVEVDGRWAAAYPCEIFKESFGKVSSGASMYLKAASSAPGPKVEEAWLGDIRAPDQPTSRAYYWDPQLRDIVIKSGVYRGPVAELHDEDYGTCIHATLVFERRTKRWLGTLEYDDCGGGMNARWSGTRRVAVAVGAWPRTFDGKTW